MASIGKKILSAFVEVTGEDKPSSPVKQAASPPPANPREDYPAPPGNSTRFGQYFDKLFRDANLPGPDYFEFSKMTEAMSSIPDEKARYSAAYAGLQVQGLDKQKLLSTATEYLRLLDADASSFDATVDAALQEKVYARQKEIGQTSDRIVQLSKEIEALQQQVSRLTQEIKENEEKIASNSGGYKTELGRMKTRILQDIEKIKQHIH